MPKQMLKFRTMSLLIFCARRKYDSLLLLLFIADLVWNLVLKLCLMSCRLELSHWSMPALLLHERIAFPRSHYHVGNLACFFFLNGPESYMLELQNMSSSPHPLPTPKKQQMVTDHLKIAMLQQKEVRSNTEILLSAKWTDTMGWKRAGERKTNMKQEDRNHISSQCGDK